MTDFLASITDVVSVLPSCIIADRPTLSHIHVGTTESGLWRGIGEAGATSQNRETLRSEESAANAHTTEGTKRKGSNAYLRFSCNTVRCECKVPQMLKVRA